MALAAKEAHTSRDRILAAATDLFARYGYDSVTTRQIGAEAGLNIATVHHHVGTKRDLYLAVIENLFQDEEGLVDALLDSIDDDVIADREALRVALTALIARLLDFARANPARQRLYVRRWLEPADDLRAREAELTLTLYRRLARVLKRGQELGVVSASLDIGYFLRSFDWMMFGYFTGGAFNWRSLRSDPFRSENVARFRDYLVNYTVTMLGI